jgi:diguanylate cyclase (GGDEF)-like protein/PAS domain S-box-containing protein
MESERPDYQRLTELSADGCFRLNFDQGLTYVNRGFLQMTGYSSADVLQRPKFFDSIIQPSSLKTFQTVKDRMQQGLEETNSVVIRLFHREGRTLWVEMFFVVAKDVDDQVIGIDGHARDISEHLEVADLLSRRTREQAVLLQVQRELLAQLELPSSLDTIVEKTCALLNASECTLYLLADDGTSLMPVASTGKSADQMMQFKPKVGEGLTGWVVEMGLPQRVDHSSEDPRILPMEGGPEEDIGLLCAPLQVGDRVSGALRIGGLPGQFSDEDLDLLVALSQVASLAVANTQLFAEVQHLATMDDLTGAYNRNYFNAHLENELNRARRLDYSLGLLIVDVDDLKKVNDQYGHVAGDDLLKAVVRVLKTNIRETDWVARYGGDEFAVVLPGCSGLQLRMIGEKLQTSMKNASLDLPSGEEVMISVSIGGASYPDDVGDMDDLVREADTAELKAKRAGGNRIVVLSNHVREPLDLPDRQPTDG